MIRLDRNRSGGGFCTYIRSCINYTRRLDLEIQFLEMLTLKTPKTLPMGSVIILPKLVQVFLQTFPGQVIHKCIRGIGERAVLVLTY